MIPLVASVGEWSRTIFLLDNHSVVVKKTGPPRRTVILSKLTVVSSFEEWSVLEVGAGQSFRLEMVRTVIP